MLTSATQANAKTYAPSGRNTPLQAHGHLPTRHRSAFARSGAIDNSERIGRAHDQGPSAATTIVDISPRDAVNRRSTNLDGMSAEIVDATSHSRTEYRFRAPVHLLAVYEHASRHDGETFVEGLPRSRLRNMTRKFTFVPAGHEYHEWQEPRTPARIMHFYLDPAKLDIYSDMGITDISFAPRLFFEDSALWESAVKLKQSIEHAKPENQLYFEAIGAVLMHELVRLDRGTPQSRPQIRGGLAVHQQRLVSAYIEEHLDEQISLATLAGLANLSPHHFCRAFKQSFGVPPHRYHSSLRIDRAKAMLAKGSYSVTEIGFAVGFSETSSFSAAFRKATGVTPRGYQRGLG